MCIRDRYKYDFYSLATNLHSDPTSKTNDTVVDELNRRNSVISATCTSNSSYAGNVDSGVKLTDLHSKHLSSEYIPYGKAKNITTLTNETQNVMKGSPTVTSSRYAALLYYIMGNPKKVFSITRISNLLLIFFSRLLLFYHFSMENDNAELYGGGVDYDNYYENSGWYQDEYGERYQDPNYANLPNGSIPNGMSGNKTQATINNLSLIHI